MANLERFPNIPWDESAWMTKSFGELVTTWINHRIDANMNQPDVTAALKESSIAFDMNLELLQNDDFLHMSPEEKITTMCEIALKVAELGVEIRKVGENLRQPAPEVENENYYPPDINAEFLIGKKSVQVGLNFGVEVWNEKHLANYSKLTDAKLASFGWYSLFSSENLEENMYTVTISAHIGEQRESDTAQYFEEFVKVSNENRYLAYAEAVLKGHWKMAYIAMIALCNN